MSKGIKMNKKTLAALKASIQHWKENEAAESSDDVSVWGDYCALCQLFVVKNESCDGCPVAKRTGKEQCDGSPWGAARDEFKKWRWAYLADGQDSPRATEARDAFRTAARAEREFLESLLPEGEQ